MGRRVWGGVCFGPRRGAVRNLRLFRLKAWHAKAVEFLVSVACSIKRDFRYTTITLPGKFVHLEQA